MLDRNDAVTSWSPELVVVVDVVVDSVVTVDAIGVVDDSPMSSSNLYCETFKKKKKKKALVNTQFKFNVEHCSIERGARGVDVSRIDIAHLDSQRVGKRRNKVNDVCRSNKQNKNK